MIIRHLLLLLIVVAVVTAVDDSRLETLNGTNSEMASWFDGAGSTVKPGDQDSAIVDKVPSTTVQPINGSRSNDTKRSSGSDLEPSAVPVAPTSNNTSSVDNPDVSNNTTAIKNATVTQNATSPAGPPSIQENAPVSILPAADIKLAVTPTTTASMKIANETAPVSASNVSTVVGAGSQQSAGVNNATVTVDQHSTAKANVSSTLNGTESIINRSSTVNATTTVIAVETVRTTTTTAALAPTTTILPTETVPAVPDLQPEAVDRTEPSSPTNEVSSEEPPKTPSESGDGYGDSYGDKDPGREIATDKPETQDELRIPSKPSGQGWQPDNKLPLAKPQGLPSEPQRYDEMEQPQNTHFFTYLIICVGLFVVAYLVMHNRKRLLAMILEGSRGKSRTKGRKYRSLSNKDDVESSKHMIY